MAINKTLLLIYGRINDLLNKFKNGDINNIAYLNQLTIQFVSLMDMRAESSDLLNDEDILSIEQHKLAIIKGIFSHFSETSLVSNPAIRSRKDLSIFKKIFMYSYAILSPFFTGISGFFGCLSMLNIFFSITNPVSLITGIVVGALEAIFSIGGDVKDVGDLLGVSFWKTAPLMETYRKQLGVIKKIHHHLLSSYCYAQLKAESYKKYQAILNVFHEDLNEKHQMISSHYEESFLRKGIKILADIVKGTLCIGSGFFTGQYVLSLFVTASFIAGPIGIGICSALAVFFLASYIYLQKDGVRNIIDRMRGDPKKLKLDQEHLLNDEKGISGFNNEMNLIIQWKRRQEFESPRCKNKIIYPAKNIDTVHMSSMGFFHKRPVGRITIVPKRSMVKALHF